MPLAKVRDSAGSQYSTDRVQAQLGRNWGQDPGSAIQPRIYSHPSVTQLELPESGSVRVQAGQPVLSDLFVPFRQPMQVRQHQPVPFATCMHVSKSSRLQWAYCITLLC